MTLELTVDIGGTFTDLVGYDDEAGRLFGAKSPTTPRISRSDKELSREETQRSPRERQTQDLSHSR